MRNAFAKEACRSIARSLGRFLTIAAIVALGAGFYAGLRMTAPDMLMAADEYYDGTALMDIRVTSTLGLTDDDLAALHQVEGVEAVMGAYEVDVMAEIGSEQYATRVHSLPEAAQDSDTSDGVHAYSDDDDYLNRPLLVEGSWPENEGECVLSADLTLNDPKSIGDTVVVEDGTQDLDGTLKTRTYTVVGFVTSPYYSTSPGMGSTTLGTGIIKEYMYVLESNFEESFPYTEAYLAVEGAAAEQASSDAYYDIVAETMERVEALAPEREQARADELAAEAAQQLAGADQSFGVAAEQQAVDVGESTWYVMDRTQNYGVASFEGDAERVDAIAQVFPFVFFLVAVLVTLTTMARMVEEERTYIGTLRALGYRRFHVASKYLVYALLASGVGGVVGIAVLSQALPSAIMRAYAIMYPIPFPSLPLPVHGGLAALSLGLGLGVTLAATGFSVWATLREETHALMRPRVPKAGKRILLERVTSLWRRISFLWKVTWRNLSRYKRRLVMTVVGVAGCTALLITGMGLYDAVNDIIDKQFGEITKYNATVTLADAAVGDSEEAVEERRAVTGILDESGDVSSYAMVLQECMLASASAASNGDGGGEESGGSGGGTGGEGENGGNGGEIEDSEDSKDGESIMLVVPQDADSFGDFVALRTRVGARPLDLSENGLVISEKLASDLGLEVGDTITFTEQDAIGNPTSVSFEATVEGIAEYYIYHYAFMSPELYESLTGEKPACDEAYACVSEDAEARANLDASLHADDGVQTVSYNDETIELYRTMMSSLSAIMVLLMVSAAVLAFVVLYNLVNINIIERMREIATLKVLGFTPRELNAYIFRETFLLAAFGCVVGLALGAWLESFVVVTAEVNQVMFGRDIHLSSFVEAFVLTMLFTVAVMFAMCGRLGGIDMVESLKSNE